MNFTEPSFVYTPCQLEHWNSFSFHAVDEAEIINALFDIKSNAVGLDGVPLKFLKLLLPLIIKPVTHIFNSIIITNTFPKSWKNAKILPIKKKSKENSLENLRPISILPGLSKVFEKLLKNQMCFYINENNLLSPHQSGYRPKHSTKTVILKVVDDIGIMLDKGNSAILMLLDFSKAFDTISHGILCRKLQHNFGFSCDAVLLIKSYLSNRFQAVHVNNEYSELTSVSSGVPQGSILGPILFSLYVNDLPNVLKYCKIEIFADDVQLYYEFTSSDAENITNNINADLKNVFNWTMKHNLRLNVNKTHALFITANNTNVSKPVIVINGNVIEYVQSATSLGYTIQSSLDWDPFVQQQCGKVYGKLRSQQLQTYFLSTEMKLSLFKTLILPHFLTCDFLIMQISAIAFNRLKIALNACVRYVFNLSRFSHVSHLQNKLIGCSFENFSKLRCCQLVFMLTNNKCPDYLYNKLSQFRSERSKKFIIHRHHTAKYSKSFFVRGVCYWNTLPNELTLISSGAVFKRKCIEHFN